MARPDLRMTRWLLLLPLALALLAGCGSDNLTFLDPQGPVAAAQRLHLFQVVGLLMIVVLPVLLLTPFIAWRYRRRNEKSRYAPKWAFAWPLEIAIWGVPVVVVAVLAVLLWHSTDALDPYEPLQAQNPPLRVQVVGLDWKWLFIYPDQRIATVGVLGFPADRPLALELTAGTVMQSFFIPSLGGQIYAMAGMVTRLHLKADGPGRFQGENTQYSGNGFYRQKFAAIGMGQDEFEGWVKSVQAGGIALDDATYAKLARRSTTETAREELGSGSMPKGVLYFSEVPADLFSGIVDKFRHGKAGQTAGQASLATANDHETAALARRRGTREEAGL